MAPGGKPRCLTTLPAVRHCQSQCELGSQWAREKTALMPDPIRRSLFGCTTLDSRRGYGHDAPEEGPVGTLCQPAALGSLP